MIFRAAIALALCSGPAFSHDWYPLSCCSEKDCWEIEHGGVTSTEAGWRIEATGEVIPYEATRMTPPEGNGKFHRCAVGGKHDGLTIGISYGKPCLWAPPMGF